MVPTKQGGHQAAGLCVAICFGVGGGIIVGKKRALQALLFQWHRCVSTHVDEQLQVISLFLFTLGCILRLPIWGDPPDDNCFNDEPYWEVRDESSRVNSRMCTVILCLLYKQLCDINIVISDLFNSVLILRSYLRMKRASHPSCITTTTWWTKTCKCPLSLSDNSDQVTEKCFSHTKQAMQVAPCARDLCCSRRPLGGSRSPFLGTMFFLL